MDRICSKYLDKVTTAEQAASLIKSNMVLGCSGFASIGYPKALPAAIAKLGQAKDLTILTGASVGKELDGVLSDAGLECRRMPYQNN